ncbi:response regulator [candidate division KSB1 bacterium]
MNKEKKTFQVLLVEDTEHDRLLFERSLDEAGIDYNITWCEKAEDAEKILKKQADNFDIAVLDYKLPGKTGLELCKIIKDKNIDLPLIISTGGGSEKIAVEALKIGVDDYIVKDAEQSYLELMPLIITEVCNRHDERIARKKAEEEKEKLIVELKNTLEELKTIKGLLPICANCKKIRNDGGYWEQIEVYIQDHSDAEFSHGICPDCKNELYGNFLKKNNPDQEKLI